MQCIPPWNERVGGQSAKHRNDVAKVTSRLSLEHDITVSVTVKPLEQFRRYQTALPYYRNVVREGIRYAGT